MRARSRPTRVWRMPIFLGVVIAVGLVAALVGDGVWDAVSWIVLAVPVVVCWRSLPSRTSH